MDSVNAPGHPAASVDEGTTYTVEDRVFDLEPDLVVGVVIAHGVTNRPSTQAEADELRAAEADLRNAYGENEVRRIPQVARYRALMERAGINPNRFPPSSEAMLKRILKGGELPLINVLVDRPNTISIRRSVSLGAHDLAGMGRTIELRFSRGDERFLPMGATDWEDVPEGELVFVADGIVQTRRFLWRQSEQGKSDMTTSDVFFHLVGFRPEVEQALDEVTDLAKDLGGSTAQVALLDRDRRSVAW